jgi:hypothetical protein
LLVIDLIVELGRFRCLGRGFHSIYFLIIYLFV